MRIGFQYQESPTIEIISQTIVSLLCKTDIFLHLTDAYPSSDISVESLHQLLHPTEWHGWICLILRISTTTSILPDGVWFPVLPDDYEPDL